MENPAPEDAQRRVSKVPPGSNQDRGMHGEKRTDDCPEEGSALNSGMKTISPIIAGGGWKGTRVGRIRVKAWITLFIALGLGCLSILAIGSVGFYACIPAGISLIAAVVLFIREQPLEFESFAGRVGADPRKLYARRGGHDLTSLQGTARHAVPTDGDQPSN